MPAQPRQKLCKLSEMAYPYSIAAMFWGALLDLDQSR